MKFIAVTLLALVSFAAAGPISVSNNNVGDIVTVDFDANAVLSSNIDQNIISVIAALLNQQAVGIDVGSVDAHSTSTDDKAKETPLVADAINSEDIAVESSENESPKFNIPPELIEKVKGLFNKQ